MYTTKTKMLWGLLPGSISYDPELELYVMIRQWRSRPFIPKKVPENRDYILRRSFRCLERLPNIVTSAFGILDSERFELLEPDQAELSIFPRIFECKDCGRVQSFRPPEGLKDGSEYFSYGFKCQKCNQNSRFRQFTLVQVHQCGYMGQMKIIKCPAHGYNHLYINRQGTNLTSKYRLVCMGPDGTRGNPSCSTMEPRLLLPGPPANHPPKVCSLEKEIRRRSADGDLDSVRIASEWEKLSVRIRTCQDPLVFRPVGLAVINPSFQVPTEMVTNTAQLNSLIQTHISQPGSFNPETSTGGLSLDQRTDLLGVIAAFEGIKNMLTDEEKIKGAWEHLKKSIRDGVPVPATYEAAKAMVGQAPSDDKDGKSENGLLLGQRHDREELIDDLIEMVHLRDSSSEFDGLSETLTRLEEYEREAAVKFAEGKSISERLGFSDVRLSTSFEIVQVQIGFIRNMSDPRTAMVKPFEEAGESKIPFYTRQTSTEAILVLLDPVRVIQWLRTSGLLQPDIVSTLPTDLTEESARRWLLENIDHSGRQGFGMVNHQPTAAVLGLIHTLSHLMIRTSGDFSGIESKAMKELLYPSLPGFVLYSIQHGGFHLGGLTSLYEDHLRDWLSAVNKTSKDCSNDPLCRAGRIHDTSNTASCYACLEGSELSCSLLNRNLDRAYLQGTVPQRTGNKFVGFWSER